MSKVLIVEDETAVSKAFQRVLGADGHECAIAGDVESAWRELSRSQFDLMLCDIGLPGESGLSLVESVRAALPDLAILMVTGEDDPALAQQAFDHGAAGYLVKPARANDLRIQVGHALTKRERDLQEKATLRETTHSLQERTGELWQTLHNLARSDDRIMQQQEETIRLLTHAGSLVDNAETGSLDRVAASCEMLAKALGWTSTEASALGRASRLHDIGYLGLSERLLQKRAVFDSGDIEEMRRHPMIAGEVLNGVETPLLKTARLIAMQHHERWDGGGYPLGLKGESIDISARIAAVCDVFDALTSRRPHRKARPLRDAVSEMQANHGAFDPKVFAAFLEILPEVVALRL
jgi:putative two-component system response regulator